MINLQNKKYKHMKKRIFAFIMSLICFLSVMAQQENFNREKLPTANQSRIQQNFGIKEDILKLKMDYFKKNLIVNEKYAEKFWMLFDTYLKAERQIHEETKKLLEEKGIKKEKGIIDFTTLNDEQIYFYFENHFKQKERLTENEQTFYRQIKEILFAQEVAEFYRLEREFKKEVSQESRKKEDMEKGKMEMDKMR
jgi:hypothetical protein